MEQQESKSLGSGIAQNIAGMMRSVVSLFSSAVEAAEAADKAVASSTNHPMLSIPSSSKRKRKVRIPDILPVECT